MPPASWQHVFQILFSAFTDAHQDPSVCVVAALQAVMALPLTDRFGKI
jgi:hypothetical protein